MTWVHFAAFGAALAIGLYAGLSRFSAAALAAPLGLVVVVALDAVPAFRTHLALLDALREIEPTANYRSEVRTVFNEDRFSHLDHQSVKRVTSQRSVRLQLTYEVLIPVTDSVSVAVEFNEAVSQTRAGSLVGR